MKVKHKILWLSYLAFIRQYYTLEKIMNNIYSNGIHTYTIDKARYHG